jgi:dimethylaniline monooxygenase (N-oxide forming)
MNGTGERVCVLGAGISGIGATATLIRNGFSVTVLEKSASLGSIWADTYHGVSLQNSKQQFHYCNFPWPFLPDEHPTAGQVQRYNEMVVDHFNIRQYIKFSCNVISATLDNKQSKWIVVYSKEDAEEVSEEFDFLVLAVGQFYNSKRPTPNVPGIALFKGEITVEKNVRSADKLEGKTVLVNGFGKSALDIAVLAAKVSGKVTHHVFRKARWTLPKFLMQSVHYMLPLFARLSTLFMTAWDHSLTAEKILHQHFKPAVKAFWALFKFVIRASHSLDAKGPSSASGPSNVSIVLNPPQNLCFDYSFCLCCGPS